ncbi:hypothetical protein STEG23_030826, partial [Scotinomys teguina]
MLVPVSREGGSRGREETGWKDTDEQNSFENRIHPSAASKKHTLTSKIDITLRFSQVLYVILDGKLLFLLSDCGGIVEEFYLSHKERLVYFHDVKSLMFFKAQFLKMFRDCKVCFTEFSYSSFSGDFGLYFRVERHLGYGCFQVLAITNKAAMNIVEQASL